MRGAIMQPSYLPWLGYFAMIDDVEIFVFLDDVQLTKRSWQVRNRIKERSGKELMLTIPVHTQGRDNTRICDATFASPEWGEKHLASIRQNYSKAPYFEEVYTLMENVYMAKIEKLSEFHIRLITSICGYLGITTKLLKSSDLEGIIGNKDDLLVNICKKSDITCYLSARGSSVYIESESRGGAFSKASIELEYQKYEHPSYSQLGKTFLPYMGIVDLLFNEGKKSLSIIRSGVRKSYTSDNVFEEENGH